MLLQESIMNATKIFLYLAKRDHSEAKLIMTLQGLPLLPTKVNDISVLKLSHEIIPELQALNSRTSVGVGALA